MILVVDPGSPVPPYEQIRAQVTTMAATGVLAAGTRLPTIRQLAADLGLAAGTVARAYRELEQSGVIATRGRRGTFVLPPRSSSSPDAGVASQLTHAARSFAVVAAQLGVPRAEALTAAGRALDELAVRHRG